MFARGKSKDRSSTRKVTPPSPSYMSNDQFAAYLADLRNNRVNRPTGARPPPPASASRRDSGRVSIGGGRPSLGSQAPSETSSLHQRNNPEIPAGSVSGRPSMAASRPSLAASVSSRYSTMSQGRDYIPDKPLPVKPLKPSDVVPSSKYIERGQRWMEKEEAVSLRQAMEDLDLRDQVTGKAVPKVEPEDEEERRLYNAALQEAAELVWQHQNPDKVPQPGGPYRYKPHLRKNSYQHARTASAGLYGDDVVPTGLARDPMSRSVSGSSASSDGFGSMMSRTSLANSRRQSSEQGTPRQSLDKVPRQVSTDSSKKAKSYGPLASAGYFASQGHRRRSSLKRNISGEIQKPFSGDQIWEEPESRDQTPQKASNGDAAQKEDLEPLRMKPKNPLNRVQFVPEMAPEADSATPTAPPAKSVVSRTEIYRNPPSQSRNPQYTSTSPSASSQDLPPPREADPVPRKQGVEIRSEDIRQATSMKLKDRSAKLPTPSAVSDNPGRPIVSFDRKWKPADEVVVAAADQKVLPAEDKPKPSTASELNNNNSSSSGSIARSRSPFVARQEHRQQQQQAQVVPTIAVSEAPSPAAASSTPAHRRSPFARPAVSLPSIQIDAPSAPSIPTIAVSDADTNSSAPPSIPTIVLPDDPPPTPSPSIPTIVTPDDTPQPTSRRPLPTPQPNAPRTNPRRSHWSPAPTPATPSSSSSRSTALCGECHQPITGRFVSLSGIPQRFHPPCFRCHTCGTSLEALEISPEPDTHRSARLSRIAARARGETLPETPGETMAEDGDERLRFYCHLDWHELFAPRCNYCTTPILGEHVVALGGKHFHQGHFFCAECGDPFGPGDTHIEKDGYAWCVGCQTKRTERRAPKCRACKGPVVGSYVQALGGEWHDGCFRCGECGGGFGDGQVFPVEGKGVVCTGCRVRALKA